MWRKGEASVWAEKEGSGRNETGRGRRKRIRSRPGGGEGGGRVREGESGRDGCGWRRVEVAHIPWRSSSLSGSVSSSTDGGSHDNRSPRAPASATLLLPKIICHVIVAADLSRYHWRRSALFWSLLQCSATAVNARVYQPTPLACPPDTVGHILWSF